MMPTPLPAFGGPSSASAGAKSPAGTDDGPAEGETGAGGFHESSYELQHGLQVSESDWPDDVTMPGALDDD